MKRLLLLSVSLIFATGCSKSSEPTNVNTSSTQVSSTQTRETGGLTNSRSTTSPQTGSSTSPILPDSKLTPGDTLDVTKADICVPGYSKKVRDVPEEVKRQAYAEYGITSHQPHEYEVDHLISLELGGSNSLKNLWPESYETEPWNARVKDKLENELHRLICAGQLELKEAQRAISTNWIEAYQKYLGEPGQERSNAASKPDSKTGKNSGAVQAAGNKPSSSATSSVIIGNKKSHLYHKPGCPDYDKVSMENRVEFHTAAEAEQAGYRLAKNCSQ